MCKCELKERADKLISECGFKRNYYGVDYCDAVKWYDGGIAPCKTVVKNTDCPELQRLFAKEREKAER